MYRLVWTEVAGSAARLTIICAKPWSVRWDAVREQALLAALGLLVPLALVWVLSREDD